MTPILKHTFCLQFKNKCGLQSHYGTFILQLEDGGAESKACKQAAANIFEGAQATNITTVHATPTLSGPITLQATLQPSTDAIHGIPVERKCGCGSVTVASINGDYSCGESVISW